MQSKQLPDENQSVQSFESVLFDPKSQKYFFKLLNVNGKQLFRYQTSHIMIMYFIIQAIASSGCINAIDRKLIINYIKSLQLEDGGFASSSLYTNYNKKHELNLPHIVFSYSAVNILKMLGGLNQINGVKCLQSVRRCCKATGQISNFENSNQSDLRFIYAGLSICKILNDFSGLDKQKIKSYIDKCFNYDGGYGLRPYCQSHSGAVYCAVSAYKLLELDFQHQQETLEFLVKRQTTNQSQEIVGVQGRLGKLPDSCYTFWVGASIKILTGQNLLNQKVERFLKLCYNEESFSFSKYPKMTGDPIHTLHSSIGLKILNQRGQNIDLIKGITKITQWN